MINPRRALAAAAAALALCALAAPASAAAQNVAAGSPQTSVSGIRATTYELTASSGADALKSQVVSPDSACTAPYFPGGEGICNTKALIISDANNNVLEVFVIGLDWSIWHAWPGSNGWHSLLGGQAQHVTGTNSGVFRWSSNPYAIWVHGNDAAGTQYCDNWGIPAWGGWHRCT